MGKIFRRQRTRADGTVYEESSLSIQYYNPNVKRVVIESVHSPKRKAAEMLLALREGSKARGEQINPRNDRVTVEELFKLLETDYSLNEKRTEYSLEWRLRLYLRPYFGVRRVVSLTGSDIEGYKLARRAAKASKASVNRELSHLRRAFRLGAEQGKISTKTPTIKLFDESEFVRRGFFEPGELVTLCGHLPEHLRPLVELAYYCGWRKAELTSLTWGQIDMNAYVARLETTDTKSRKAREFHFAKSPAICALFQDQLKRKKDIERKKSILIPYVFFRGDGRPVGDFRKSWGTACKEAKLTGRLFHDLRRSAVRNMIRAGIPERVAMMISGHETRSIFDRYHIVSSSDLVEASAKIVSQIVSQTGEVKDEAAAK